jgi:hypothetical protein
MADNKDPPKPRIWERELTDLEWCWIIRQAAKLFDYMPSKEDKYNQQPPRQRQHDFKARQRDFKAKGRGKGSRHR